MTPRDFCYWLQGFFELQRSVGITAPVIITEKQSETIENHLKLVFAHSIDPSIDKGDPNIKKLLDEIHSSTPHTMPPLPGQGVSFPGTPIRC